MYNSKFWPCGVYILMRVINSKLYRMFKDKSLVKMAQLVRGIRNC
jgi:hypothetical protein